MQHLIADGLKRTPKFLLAMNQAPIVVTSSWVEACVKADALVGESMRGQRRAFRSTY